jgi:hypothetical protein
LGIGHAIINTRQNFCSDSWVFFRADFRAGKSGIHAGGVAKEFERWGRKADKPVQHPSALIASSWSLSNRQNLSVRKVRTIQVSAAAGKRMMVSMSGVDCRDKVHRLPRHF